MPNRNEDLYIVEGIIKKLMQALENLRVAELRKEMLSLRPRQQDAYDAMVAGQNIFITGPAGTGKTAAIKMFKQVYQESKRIAITSTTGTSAILINGTTLHSYLGIGLGKGSVESMSSLIFQRGHLRKRWTELEVLIIDEVSMMSPVLFDKLESLARVVRHTNQRFGGIQLIMSGDFLQLPCVDSNEFCFHASAWVKCIDSTFYLTEIIRQSDPVFQECLNRVRLADLTDEVVALLSSRVGAKLENDHGIQPTRLFPMNRDVDSINTRELDRAGSDGRVFYQYDMEPTVYGPARNRVAILEKFVKGFSAPEVLQLCVGAQVLLLYNMDVANKLANGSRGVVVRFANDLPVVKFLSGEERVIDYHTWEFDENDVRVLQLIQIPLKLAYAVSIHRSQGCSLDYAEVDLANVFEYSQAYVALSRVKTLEGLSISSINFELLRAHPEAVRYYQDLETQ